MYSEEEQKEMEAAFIDSWDKAEHFYDFENFSPRCAWIRNMAPLVKVLRGRGYDRHLRAKICWQRLRLARSSAPLLRIDQPVLDIDMLDQGRMSVQFVASALRVEFKFDRVALTPELENLLIPLVAYPIY